MGSNNTRTVQDSHTPMGTVFAGFNGQSIVQGFDCSWEIAHNNSFFCVNLL